MFFILHTRPIKSLFLEIVQIIHIGAGGGLASSFLNYLNWYLRSPEGNLLIPFPKAGILLSPWCDLSCSSKSWEENEGLDFLPGEARALHNEVCTDLQHPAYSYCFGENRQRPLAVLSPVGSNMVPRIPSIMNISSEKFMIMASEKSRKEDQQWISQR